MDAREIRRRARWAKRWRASGLSAPQFAAQHGLKASSLYAWSGATKAPLDPAPSFAEVRVRDEPRGREVTEVAAIEVVVGECVVRVRPGADVELLAQVIAAVRRC